MRKAIMFLLVAACAAAWAEDGARLLVITADTLYNSIMPLAQWKQAAGLSTRVVKLSQVGSDTASIKNYIRDAWNTWPVKPEYVLLAGGQNYIPARAHHFWHGEYIYSDNIYGNVTGDYRADIPVGRFPAKSKIQLDVMVAKTLAYEQSPVLEDTIWLRRLTSVCRDAGDNDAYTYWSDIRNAIGLAAANGFIAFDSLASSRGHNQQSVVNSVTAGTNLVMYRGSATGNWYMPFAVDPAATANGRKLPIVLSFTCATATLAPGESMVGDAWLKAGTTAEPKGAVAFFGNTHSASNVAQQRSAVCRGFFTGLFAEHKYRLGLSCLRARDQLLQQFPWDSSDYRGFNLFGDPSLDIWTGSPKVLDVTHPADLRPGPQVLTIAVSSGGVPIESALVCASMAVDTTVYAYAYTNTNGEVSLALAPADTGQLRLVVTGHNLYPYDVTIPVMVVGLAESGRLPVAGPTELRVVPAVFSRTVRFAWGRSLEGAALGIYGPTGRAVCRLRVNGSQATWNAERLAAGIYTCELLDRNGARLGRARAVKMN